MAEKKVTLRYLIEVDSDGFNDIEAGVDWLIDNIDGHLFNTDGIVQWDVQVEEIEEEEAEWTTTTL